MSSDHVELRKMQMRIDEAGRDQRSLISKVSLFGDLAGNDLGNCLTIDPNQTRLDAAAACTVIEQQLSAKNHRYA